MAELQWRWIPDSASTADTLGCGSTSGASCTRVLTTSGTMYAAAYVNGQQQQKSVHVDVLVPTLHVVASKAVVIASRIPVARGPRASLAPSKTYIAAPGDSDSFSVTGNGPTVIQGWNFTPDSTGGPQPSVTVGSSWGSCTANIATCTNLLNRSGTVSVIGTVHGVQLTDTVHVTVKPPKFTLEANRSWVAVGDTAEVKFTPKLGGKTTTAAGWLWRSDSTTQAASANPCIDIVNSVCRYKPHTSGTMWAYASANAGGDSAKFHITVVRCPTADTILDNPIFRQLQDSIWKLSGASTLPAADRRERIALFYHDTADKSDTSYHFDIRPLNPVDSLNGPCMVNGPASTVPATWVALAISHPHPFSPGEQFAGNCPKDSRGNYLKYGATTATGWGSGTDWHASQTLHIPSYIIDPVKVIRILGDSGNVEPVIGPNGDTIEYKAKNWRDVQKLIRRTVDCSYTVAAAGTGDILLERSGLYTDEHESGPRLPMGNLLRVQPVGHERPEVLAQALRSTCTAPPTFDLTRSNE